MKWILFVFLSDVVLSFACLAQDAYLALFKPYTEHVWEGHYVDSDDSLLTHFLNFEYALDSRELKVFKRVPEVGFEMESYYYFDWEVGYLVFLSIVNKDMCSKGRVYFEKSKIILEGKTFYKGGSSDFRTILEISKEIKLIDQFFRKRGGVWEKGHLIEYN